MTEQNRRIKEVRAPGELDWSEESRTAAPASADNPSTAGAAPTLWRWKWVDSRGQGNPWRYMDQAPPNNADRVIESFVAAPVAQSTAGAADPVVMECVKAVSIGYGERGYDGETLYCIDCQTSWADGDAHTGDCLVVRARAYLAAPALNPSEVRDHALEEAAQACENERVEDTGNRIDIAYNNAITHSAFAIRALRTASKGDQAATDGASRAT